MGDILFVLFIIFIVTVLIYVLYKMMLGVGTSKDTELEITAKNLLEQINILYRQKRYSIVETLAKKYLETKPQENDIREVLIKTLYETKNLYEAIDQAKILLKNDPKNVDMMMFLAGCFLEIEQPIKSISLLQEVIEIEPNNTIAIKELAKIYYDTNQMQSAVKTYKRLEELLDNNQEKAKNKAIIAQIHTFFRDFEAAISEYTAILEMYPDDISIKKKLIEVYKATGNYEAVIEKSKELADNYTEDSNGLWAMQNLTEAYNLIKDYEQALQWANSVQKHNLSDKVEAGSNISKILLNKGEVDNSITVLNELIEANPQNIQLKKSLAACYEAKNMFEDAVKIYKKLIDEAPVSEINMINLELSNIYSHWAMDLFEKEDNQGCFNKFMTALNYSDQNPNVYYLIGNVNKSIKNFNEAISQYKKALEIWPECALYHFAMSECYEEIDSVYDQKKALLECIKFDPLNSVAQYKLGMIFDMQNDSLTALIHIKKALEADNKFIKAKYKLALLLEHTGKKEEAIEVYEEILKLEPENEEVANNLKMLKGN